MSSQKVPEEEVLLEVELVHCVMILLNKPQGLVTLEASSDLLPLLAVRKKRKTRNESRRTERIPRQDPNMCTKKTASEEKPCWWLATELVIWW